MKYKTPVQQPVAPKTAAYPSSAPPSPTQNPIHHPNLQCQQRFGNRGVRYALTPTIQRQLHPEDFEFVLKAAEEEGIKLTRDQLPRVKYWDQQGIFDGKTLEEIIPRIKDFAEISPSVGGSTEKPKIQNKNPFLQIALKKRSEGLALFNQFWHHISVGDLNDKTPTGYHWKNSGAIHEQFGVPTGVDQFGVYKQYVRNKTSKKIKADPSTFYPDDWDKGDFIEAFSKLNSSKQITGDLSSEKTTMGMQLIITGDTCYPQYLGADTPTQI